MAKKRINCKPVEEIELAFEDGKSLTLKFDAEAFSNIYDFEFGVKELMNEKSISKQCAVIIYIGGKTHNEDLTYEKACEIVSNLKLDTILEIISEFSESTVSSQNGVMSELQKKLMNQFVEKIMK